MLHKDDAAQEQPIGYNKRDLLEMEPSEEPSNVRGRDYATPSCGAMKNRQ